jgi:hypothetical protein
VKRKTGGKGHETLSSLSQKKNIFFLYFYLIDERKTDDEKEEKRVASKIRICQTGMS